MNLATWFRRASSCAVFSLTAALLFSASPAQAGPLAGDLAISFGGAWAGSTHFMTGTLEGDVERAVYKAAEFPYSGAGYTPTPGELVYAYQIYVTGAAPVSHFDVDLPNPGSHNLGSFTTFGAVAPSATSINALAAFDFFAPPVTMGSSSIGLAYSSAMPPQEWFGSVVDTGQSTFILPIPTPRSNISRAGRGNTYVSGHGAAVAKGCSLLVEAVTATPSNGGLSDAICFGVDVRKTSKHTIEELLGVRSCSVRA